MPSMQLACVHQGLGHPAAWGLPNHVYSPMCAVPRVQTVKDRLGSWGLLMSPRQGRRGRGGHCIDRSPYLGCQESRECVMPAGPAAGPAAGPSPAQGSPAMREMEPKDQQLVVSTITRVPRGPYGCVSLRLPPPDPPPLLPAWHRSGLGAAGPCPGPCLCSPVSTSPHPPPHPVISPTSSRPCKGWPDLSAGGLGTSAHLVVDELSPGPCPTPVGWLQRPCHEAGGPGALGAWGAASVGPLEGSCHSVLPTGGTSDPPAQ